MTTPRHADTAIGLVRRQAKRPLLVAIDGYSAAGKSTLARQIAQAVEAVTVVPCDDFYRVMDEDERFALSAREAYERDYDWQRLRSEVLEPLQASRLAEYRRYDWDTGSLGSLARVEPEGVVVVEGVYSLRPELRTLYDVSIFVLTPSRVRSRRQASRPESDAWKLRWDAAERFYVMTHRPHVAADLVVRCSENRRVSRSI